MDLGTVVLKFFLKQIFLQCCLCVVVVNAASSFQDLSDQLDELEANYSDRERQLVWNQKLISNLKKQNFKDAISNLAKRINVLKELNDTYNKNDKTTDYDERKVAIDGLFSNPGNYDDVLKLMSVGEKINDQLIRQLVSDYYASSSLMAKRKLGVVGTIFYGDSQKYTDEDLVVLLRDWVEKRVKVGKGDFGKKTGILGKIKESVAGANSDDNTSSQTLPQKKSVNLLF